MKLYIDADASPVKDVVIAEGAKRDLPVILVTSIPHYSSKELPAHVKTIYVDTGADAADYRIMQLIQKKDLLVTQDYGLASLALGKGCMVLHHNGFRYTQENIASLLQQRYLSAMARKGGKRTKGPKAFTAEDKEKFRSLLVDSLKETTEKHKKPGTP
ncbi:MAG: YaiI/YqxD family protein [Pisciglobus halotolerans]|nr:YaiI/YqxD family protein [Pisciglobus halotolerans]